jgi:DNA ligase-associated metallophosphoesterase
MKIVVHGEPLVLTPDRAVYRPASRRLYVADAHFGKAADFRRRGVPVPAGTTRDNLDRLDRLIARFDTHDIVFLGDFAHARVPGLYDRLRAWRQRHRGVQMRIVAGNHDRHAGAPPAELDIETIAGAAADPPFELRHAPQPAAGAFGLAGHVHPCFVLRGPGRDLLRLPCYWLTASDLVLPAFGAFTGGFEVMPAGGERIFVIADDAVVDVRGPSGSEPGREDAG